MNGPRKAVYFCCADPGRDPVASQVFAASQRLWRLDKTDLVVDDKAVVGFEDATGNCFLYVRTHDVVSHDYPYYLPILNAHFADCDVAGVVNWHEGHNAPEAILTVHTTGDVVSGHFGLAHPIYMRNLLLALEEQRTALGLAHFTTRTEGTHWSGIPCGGAPALIAQYPVPLVDIEIGSSPASWTNAAAVEAIARALPQVFDRHEAGVRSLLCLGGVHLEPAFANAVLGTRIANPCAVSHILPTRWLVDGAYNTDAGLQKLAACAASIGGGIHGIAFHASLKGVYKTQIHLFAERLGIPTFSHKALWQPRSLGSILDGRAERR